MLPDFLLLQVYAEILDLKINELLDIEYEDFIIDFEWVKGKRLAEFINDMESKNNKSGKVDTSKHQPIS